MYNRVTLACKYLSYLLHASNGRGHGTHSPFVFDFISEVLNASAKPEAFKKIESLRRRWENDDSMIDVEDFGAGSAFGHSRKRMISQIARSAAKPAKYGRLLFRIAEHYTLENVLELGTSLGLSTSYMAMAPGVKRVITMEGASSIASLAREGFESLGIQHVEQVLGNFDDTLAEALMRMPVPDLIFFDGNHREEPTLRYFRQCLPHARAETIFIFDDIHWSAEMESAWSQIKNHESVTCTIDLFFVGMVLFRPAFREKQHFSIRY